MPRMSNKELEQMKILPGTGNSVADGGAFPYSQECVCCGSKNEKHVCELCDKEIDWMECNHNGGVCGECKDDLVRG